MSLASLEKKNALAGIIDPVASELSRFQKEFKRSLATKVTLLDIVARYILSQKGKRIRPALVFLAAKACGGITDSTYRAATLVEILHTATLVHDDVVDDASTRRGLASINAVWKNKVAVLVGDFFLSRGLLLSLEHKDYYFLHSTSNAVKRMSEGELLQIQQSRRLNNDEDTYIRIISDKTASLLSTCTDIGAASASQSELIIGNMKRYGEYVGLAFQIRDDIFDYQSSERTIGKPTGNDIQEKKLTLPLIYALQTGPPTYSRKALELIKGGAKRSEIDWIVQFVRESGGIDYARKKAEEFSALAERQLELLSPSPAKESLVNFARFVVTRES